MCLNNVKIEKQEGEVICYKVLVKGPMGELHSPYYGETVWEIGETKTAECLPFDKGNIVDDFRTIHSGAFHSFKNEEDAITYYHSDLYVVSRHDVRIAKCVIPTDNGYLFSGDVFIDDKSDDAAVSGYASEKLKVVEIIDL